MLLLYYKHVDISIKSQFQQTIYEYLYIFGSSESVDTLKDDLYLDCIVDFEKLSTLNTKYSSETRSIIAKLYIFYL